MPFFLFVCSSSFALPHLHPSLFCLLRLSLSFSYIYNSSHTNTLSPLPLLSRRLEQLSAIGLDVYPDEPSINPRLLDFPQATLLPHMGTETQESQRKMEVRALTNLRGYLTKGRGDDVVPELVGVEARPVYTQVQGQ